MTVRDDLQTSAGPVRRGLGRTRIFRTTRSELAAMAVASLLAVGILAALIAVQAAGQQAGLREIGNRDAPEVMSTSDFYFALNDMDAQVANILLVGDAQNLGFTAAQAQPIFDQRRTQADSDLQQAAVTATDSATAAAIRAVLDAYGDYQALVARTLTLNGLHPHPAGRPTPDVLAAYRDATDLLDTTLLPAARNLSDRSAAALEHTYQQQHTAATRMRDAVIVVGATALAFVIMLQVFLARRFRRRINPGALGATLLCAALVGSSGWLLSAQADHLRVAKKDAFDSILALDQARAVSYDANADESRYLVDPERADRYQTAFLDKTQELVGLPGATIATFDQRLASAADAYQQDQTDIGWRGLFGTEFRNITFPGERAAAQKTLMLFQVYQLDDRHIRTLVGNGQLAAAITFCTSYQPGQSNYAFTQYDQALASLIAINQNAFTTNINSANRDVGPWTQVPWLAFAGFATLLGAGLWPRFAEYR